MVPLVHGLRMQDLGRTVYILQGGERYGCVIATWGGLWPDEDGNGSGEGHGTWDRPREWKHISGLAASRPAGFS